MRDQYYVSQAMSKYPQAPCSDLVRTWFLRLSFAVVENRKLIMIKDFPKAVVCLILALIRLWQYYLKLICNPSVPLTFSRIWKIIYLGIYLSSGLLYFTLSFIFVGTIYNHFVLIHRFLSHGHCRWGYPRFLNVSEGVWKGDLSPNGGKRLTMSLWHWGAWRRFDIHLQGLFLTLFTLLTKTNFLNEEFSYSNNIITTQPKEKEFWVTHAVFSLLVHVLGLA